jgi:uncharacterized linocin/CFP29 family protein
MNNLHRDLAPISAAAWASLEQEARRTFTLHAAGRRIVDVPEAGGGQLAAVGLGHLNPIAAPADGVGAHILGAQPLVALRVPFTVDRRQVDEVELGSQDADWQPVKDAARKLAFAEDRAVFGGYPAAGIGGIAAASPYPALSLPPEVRDYPQAISQAVSTLRLAGVDGAYTLALSADAYTAVNETSDHGHPVLRHIERVLDGEIVWAPAIEGALLVSARGGDFALRLGQDVSIGYLSHDETGIRLYFQETMTFLVYAGEAAVVLSAERPNASRSDG